MKNKAHYISIIVLTLVLTSFRGLDRSAIDYYNEGLKKLQEKEYMGAIGDFTSAVSLNPTFADAYYQRAIAKQQFAQKQNFIDNEYCSDLVSALENGKKEALPLLKENCMGECSDLNNVVEPENTFCLDLTNNNLVHVPHIADYFTNVVRLDISDNELIDINEEISHLPNLIYLDASNNQIKVIAELKSAFLEELNLSNNHLQKLPNNFGELKSLKTVYLSKNKLTEIPSLAEFSSLEYIDLSFNKLKTLPEGLVQLPHLKFINLIGNDLNEEEKARIQKILPKCEILLD